MDKMQEYQPLTNDLSSDRSLYFQMRKWKFPGKCNRVPADEQLVTRIKQLWENNLTAKDMLQTLNDEGFECSEQDVTRVRHKNGLKLRLERTSTIQKARAARKASKQKESGGDHEPGADYDDPGSNTPAYNDPYDASSMTPGGTYLDPSEDINEQRRRMLAADVEEKRLTKKRRRWTRPHAGLPADPPGPPRFPSEMTLTECQGVLSMEKAVYLDVRAKFKRICEEQGIIKKTISGPEKWEAAKHQLVRETMHLRGVFWDPDNMDLKKLALDLICCDVTKSMRAAANNMSLPHARSILGLNPQQSREVRLAFQAIMREVQFVSKRLLGDEEWNNLKQRWIAQTPIMQNIAMSLDATDPSYSQKTKAIEWVSRDAMRRYLDWTRRGIDPFARLESPPPDNEEDENGQEDVNAAGNPDGEFQVPDFTDPDNTGFPDVDDADAAQIAQLSMMSTGNQNQTGNPEPPPKKRRGRPPKKRDGAGETGQATEGAGTDQQQPTMSQPKKRGRPPGSGKRGGRSQLVPGNLISGPNDEARFVLMDPEANQAPQPVSNPAPAATQPQILPSASTGPNRPQGVTATPQQQQNRRDFRAAAPAPTTVSAPVANPTPARVSVPAPTPSSSSRSTIAVYFRIHPSTTIIYGLPMWITTMSVGSVEEVRSKAVARYPEAVCALVEGIVKDGMGGEIPLPIPGDEELKAYLEHVKEIGGAPTFNVQLVNGWEAA